MERLLTSVEFYVVAVVVAAAIVAFAARPAKRGPSRQFILSGILTREEQIIDPGTSISSPSPHCVEFMANDDGSVTLIRRGLKDLTEDSAVSLVIEVTGFDLKVQERISAGSSTSSSLGSWPIDTATFTLDFLAPEYYHIQYSSPDSGLFLATSFHNRPGIHFTKALQ